MSVAETASTFETHWYDVVVVVGLIIGLWSGMRMGFSGEALRAVSLVLGVIAGMEYYATAGQWLTKHSCLVPERANLMMFVAIMFGVYLVFGLFRLAVKQWTRERPLSAFTENFGGAMAGLVRMGAIMVAVTIYFCLLQSEFWHEQVGRESRFGQYVVRLFPDLAPVVQKRELEKVWFLRDPKRRPDFDIEQTISEKLQKSGPGTPPKPKH